MYSCHAYYALIASCTPKMLYLSISRHKSTRNFYRCCGRRFVFSILAFVPSCLSRFRDFTCSLPPCVASRAYMRYVTSYFRAFEQPASDICMLVDTFPLLLNRRDSLLPFDNMFPPCESLANDYLNRVTASLLRSVGLVRDHPQTQKKGLKLRIA
jgi:hypothetical protein